MPARRVQRSSLEELARYAEEERKRIEAATHMPCHGEARQADPARSPKLAFIIKIVDDDAEADITGEQLAALIKRSRKESSVYLPAS